MNERILIELRTAINVASNTFLQLCHGDRRTQQYVDGLNGFFKYTDQLKGCDIVLVDNTLENDEYVPPQIRECLSDDTFLYVKNKNHYGQFNKGAGIIDMWKDYSDILTTYDYFFYYEPRLILKDFSFIKSFLDNPRNCFTLCREDQVRTGYFGANVKDLYEFYSKIDLDHMVQNFISLEDMMFHFFKQKNTEFKNATYCLWHDVAYGDKYVKY